MNGSLPSSGLRQGHTAHLGSQVTPGGVNFNVYSKYATAAELLLFDHEDAAEPSRCFPLDPRRHRTYHYWHCEVEGIGPGQIYAYRVEGPWAPERGLRFDSRNLLLDPYFKGKVEKAQPEEQLEMVFSDKAYEKAGFKVEKK
mgnify:CR=1 FL=1